MKPSLHVSGNDLALCLFLPYSGLTQLHALSYNYLLLVVNVLAAATSSCQEGSDCCCDKQESLYFLLYVHVDVSEGQQTTLDVGPCLVPWGGLAASV